METVTVTLTDFLLARIAEDEEAAHRIATTSCYGVESAAEDAYFRFADRASAECEAKRQIVDLFPSSPDGDGWNEAGGHVLALLALPYADHPDYRDEWKP